MLIKILWTIRYDRLFTKGAADSTDLLFPNGISGISFLCLVKDSHLCVILGYRREIDENCDLLDYQAASSGNLLPTFRNKISVPTSRLTYTVNVMFFDPCILN